jgi:hypothetical protein
LKSTRVEQAGETMAIMELKAIYRGARAVFVVHF